MVRGLVSLSRLVADAECSPTGLGYPTTVTWYRIGVGRWSKLRCSRAPNLHRKAVTTAFESRWGFPKLPANPCSFKGQPLPRTEQEKHRLKPEESQGGPKPSLGLIARSRGVFSNAALGHALVLGLGRGHQHLDLAFVWGVECGMFGFLGG